MRRLLLAASLLIARASAGADCPDGKCSKQDCADKFGSPYEILVDAPPSKRDGDLFLKVKYSSVCPAGSATFTAKVMPPHTEEEEAEGGTALLAQQKVIYVHRAEAQCNSPMPFATEVTETVQTKLPVAVGVPVGEEAPVRDTFEYIAFPPDGAYDMMKL